MYRAFGYRFYRNAPGKLSIPSPTGKGDRPQAVDEGRYGVVCYRNNRRKGNHAESHRRERPMCRSAAWQIQSVWTKRNHPRHVIPSERSESRNLPKLHVLPCVGTFLPRSGFLHSACAAVGMTKLGYVSTDSPIVSGMFHAAPPPHQSRLRRASFPQGKLLYRGLGCRVLSVTVPSFHVRNGT